MTTTPRSEGFRLPAEWEPHEATWLAWPHNQEDWPGKFGPIPWVVAEVVRALTPGELVRILVNGKRVEVAASEVLTRAGVPLERVEFVAIATDRSWTRDFLPSFVVREGSEGGGAVGVVAWQFNAWAKYSDHTRDQKVADRIARRLDAPSWTPVANGATRVVLEGGAIDSDGQGTLLATEECLLSDVQARNPGLDRAGLERIMHDFLAIDTVIWLGRGIAGDDTHGHVDDITRFVAPGRVVTAIETNRRDVNHSPLRENLNHLKRVRDAQGRALEVIELPMPAPVVFEGQRLPASYANFYAGNRAVIVPTFNDPADRRALEILGACFPDRVVMGIHARDLVWGLGTLHCMTHEQPAAPARSKGRRRSSR